MLIDETFCRPSARKRKPDQQLEYRPGTYCGGLPSLGLGCVAGAGWWGPPKPKAKDPGLQGIINQLYRPGAKIGNGGTAYAIRAGVGHAKKGGERITNISRWIDRNAGAEASDIHTAQSLLQDLISAMTGQGYPGPP
jgi:hypothetical protein